METIKKILKAIVILFQKLIISVVIATLSSLLVIIGIIIGIKELLNFFLPLLIKDISLLEIAIWIMLLLIISLTIYIIVKYKVKTFQIGRAHV